jgi:uncharacterized protein YecE (DUF72 family)
MLRIGTAGWTIPAMHNALSHGSGTHLERYARTLNCSEINSSFYRSHRSATWQRWAESTPHDFRFSVKLPKTITHTAKLSVESSVLDLFLSEIITLGKKLGPILIQLPPSLDFGNCPAAAFFHQLRERFAGTLAIEPRHPSWFTREAEDILKLHRVARVAADPSRQEDKPKVQIPVPGGWPGFCYFRLHGSPRTYYSNYGLAHLRALGEVVAKMSTKEVWVIFDNTAHGHAFANAIELRNLLMS